MAALLLTLLVVPVVGAMFWLWRGAWGVMVFFGTMRVWVGLTAAVAVVLACFVRDE